MSRILLTGYSGFIGRAIAQDLSYPEEVKHNVSYVSRKSSVLEVGGIRLIGVHYKCDLRDDKNTTTLLNAISPDIIIHCAANPLVRGADYNIFDDNVRSTYNLIQNAGKDCHLIFLSSVIVYGDNKHAWQPHTESNPCNPTSLYGVTKLTCEGLLKTAVAAGEIKSATILRACATVGPALTHGIIKDFMRKIKEDYTLEILGDAPGSMKPFLHIDDLVSAIRLSIDNQPNDTFNVCSEDTITCATVAKAVMEGVGQEKPIRFLGEGANWKGDNRKIHCSSGRLLARGWDKLYDDSYQSILGAVNEIYMDENL